MFALCFACPMVLLLCIFALGMGTDGPVQQVTRVLTSVADVSVSAGRLASALVDRTAEASLSATGAVLAVTHSTVGLVENAWNGIDLQDLPGFVRICKD